MPGIWTIANDILFHRPYLYSAPLDVLAMPKQEKKWGVLKAWVTQSRVVFPISKVLSYLSLNLFLSLYRSSNSWSPVHKF